ncbi:MAG: AMP-binding protein [Rhodospirillales bacterium]
MPVTDEIAAVAAADPRRPALTLALAVGATGFDYGTLIARASRMARGLPGRSGIGGHDGEPARIALLTRDNAPFVPAFLAILTAGAIAVILDPKWSAAERQRALAAVRPDLLLTDLPFGDPGLPTCTPADLAHAPPLAATLPVIDDEAPFLITFTAGTTAAPKPIIRSHRSWLASLAVARDAFPIAAGEAVLVPGSLAHSLSLFALVEALSAGAHVHLLPRFDATAALDAIARHAIRRLTAAPTMYAALVARAQTGGEAGARFPGVATLVSAGAKLEPALRQDLAQVFPRARIVEYYGASELSFVAAGAADDGCPADAVGRPLPGVQVSIRDETGREAAAGATGRLWVRSPMLATAYLDGSPLTNGDGWATVGDHARLDTDGWLYLAGRDHGMLVTGGLNVYPAEVETVLRAAEAVAEAAVFGLPDAYWGDGMVAVVALRNGRRPTKAELLAHCRDRLAVYKCPKRIFLMDALPLRPSGKVAREELCRRLLAKPDSLVELAE